MLRRSLELVATAAVAVSLTFVFFQYTIEGVTAPADLLAALGRWFERLVLHLDLGESFLGSEVPVSRVLREGLAVDMTLLIGGTLAALGWALPLGAWAGAHPRSRRARTFHTGASAVLSSPVYWLGFVVLILFANDSGRIVQLSFVSGQGDYADLGGNPLDWGRAVWVPILVVGAPLGAQLLRMTAGSVREALEEDFVRTARGKGASERRVLARHALPLAATPIAMLTGVTTNLMVTNIVLMESAFNLPGSFRYIDDALAVRDANMLQALVLEWTVVIVAANLLADAVQRWIDPRVR